jgi:NADPH:quinone reductase-like Zn-dependent oxidoreductase
VQLAVKAGYTVVGVASGANAQLVKSLGASHFVDRKSSYAAQELLALGPFEAVLAAADSAADQSIIGEVLTGQRGGTFLSTMGVRPGVSLPLGVSGSFAQFLDDYLDPKNEEFTQWVWWDYLEDVLATGDIQPLPVLVLGGLSKVQEAWNSLMEGKVSGQRLVIKPDMD